MLLKEKYTQRKFWLIIIIIIIIINFFFKTILFEILHPDCNRGQIFGRSVLREHNKINECRALTTTTVHLLSRKHILEVLDKHPKIKYFAKRWTAWAVLRRYIREYSRLYYVAARRGARMIPPLLSRRPMMKESEFDDIDYAVLDHLVEVGF